MVTDLDTLLSSAEIPGPYVLVGHSFGGQVARLFAALHPLETKGIVLLDPSHEDKYTRFESVLTEQLIERQDTFLSDPSRNTEHINLLESKLQLYAADKLLNAALIVVSRGKPDKPSLIWPTQRVQEIEMELQRELLTIPGSGLRRHIVAKQSGHYIHQDEPELVLSLIREIIEAVRAGS
jgi:pimeloyl-ACP methyl ester carboxylesterase